MRIQRRRSLGWRLPEGALVVTRPTKWGNPFRVGATIGRDDELAPYLHIPGGWGQLVSVRILDAQTAVDAYFEWIVNQPALCLSVRDELAGHDLACWCPLTYRDGSPYPCHADLLLHLANEDES